LTRFIAIVLTIFTGFTGLVYEVAWQKYLATLLGSQGEATAAILAIFLGGLSIGYSLFGKATRRIVARSRQRHRSPRLLFFYGLIEAGIGVYAWLFPLLFGVAQEVSLLVPGGASVFAFGFDVLLSALLIGPPAVLMGGTIPVLTLALAGSWERSTRIHALIYGCNTAGAFVGALAGAFVLIPSLGLDGVVCAMGVVNAIAGVSFVLLDRFGERVAPDLEHGSTDTSGSIDGFKIYAAIALLAGFAMMALQTTFNRVGGLAFGSSHFTFAIVVAVFVFCIALGSLAVSLFRHIPRSAIAITQWLLVIYLLALYQQVENAPYWAHTIRALFRDLHQVFYPYYIASFLGVFLVLLIPIGLSGALLPLLFNHLRGEVGNLGSVAGRLYSWNTVGSLIGALFGGYVLLFWLDLNQIYRLALAALILESALLTAILLRLKNRSVMAVAVTLAMIGTFALPAWKQERLSAGLFRRRAPSANTFDGPEAYFNVKKRNPILFYKDGPTSTVTVRSTGNDPEGLNRSIYLNAKSDGNLISDYPTMSLLALIPALMAENLGRCFVIGFGTGVSTGELATLESVKSVDVAEISRYVIEAAPLFNAGNLGAIANPKVKIRLGDAYRTLRRDDGKYDVIVSEPSNPWVAGVEMLYSLEFLQAARSHLTPGGVYAQWMHLYALDEATVELVLRNYAAVFPYVSVWITQPRDLLLMGFDSPKRALDLAFIEDRFKRPDFTAGFRRAKVDSLPALLSHELLPLRTLNVANLEGPLHTLRHPRLSDMAARAFIAGNDTRLPKFLSPKTEEVGSRNSLLRRYVGGKQGPLPEAISAIAVKETCKVELPEECATLLAGWRLSDPESDALAKQLEQLQEDPTFKGQFTNQLLGSIGRLFGGRPVVSLEGRRSLLRARQMSGLYEVYYHYALPFDRDVLRRLWEDCLVRGCRKSQLWLERQIGSLQPSTRERSTLPTHRSGTSPVDEATDGNELSPASKSE